MACGGRVMLGGLMVFSVLFLLMNSENMMVVGKQQVPCYFIFGDSIFDNGNNNDLFTSAKANYPPYGIDFSGPTGRFTNGRTPGDFIAQYLGFNRTIPPYATARGRNIIRGVNYASGGAGIRDESGRSLGEVISLNRQLLHHEQTILRLNALQQSTVFTQEYLHKCVYTVGMGGNDYLNNYFIPQLYPSSRLFTPDQFAQQLIDMYYHQLKFLYGLGARKVAIFGVLALGCAPRVATLLARNGSICADNVNFAVQLFNHRLKPLVQRLNCELPDATYTFINISSITAGDLSAAGITVANSPCCVVSATGLCAPSTIPCSNRAQYAYYDGFHPTEIVNFLTAMRAYHAASPTDVYPVDISQLAQLFSK